MSDLADLTARVRAFTEARDRGQFHDLKSLTLALTGEVGGNGLLLRADLHTLFDLRLVTVLPHGTVRVAPELQGSEYEDFDERQVRPPVDSAHVPQRAALAEHNALCAWLG